MYYVSTTYYHKPNKKLKPMNSLTKIITAILLICCFSTCYAQGKKAIQELEQIIFSFYPKKFKNSCDANDKIMRLLKKDIIYACKDINQEGLDVCTMRLRNDRFFFEKITLYRKNTVTQNSSLIIGENFENTARIHKFINGRYIGSRDLLQNSLLMDNMSSIETKYFRFDRSAWKELFQKIMEYYTNE